MQIRKIINSDPKWNWTLIRKHKCIEQSFKKRKMLKERACPSDEKFEAMLPRNFDSYLPSSYPWSFQFLPYQPKLSLFTYDMKIFSICLWLNDVLKFASFPSMNYADNFENLHQRPLQYRISCYLFKYTLFDWDILTRTVLFIYFWFTDQPHNFWQK